MNNFDAKITGILCPLKWGIYAVIHERNERERERERMFMQVIGMEQRNTWNNYIRSFSKWDVYFSWEYAVSLMTHGDGVPYLACYEEGGARMAFVFMKKSISANERFPGHIDDEKYYDIESPYGYGGFLVDGGFSSSGQEMFFQEFSSYCAEHHIVSQFIRCHPFLANHELFRSIVEYRYVHETIYIDTSSIETIDRNMDSKNRNMVRKAKKNGVAIIEGDMKQRSSFVNIYRESMKRHNADAYYIFPDTYFEFLEKEMRENCLLLYAVHEERIIGGGIFFYANGFMHYHLAATLEQYRNLASSNLLVYEAALWANANGISKLHLGGGLKQNDSLWGFKKQFNKHGILPFHVGRVIWNKQVYQDLLSLRKANDPAFNMNNERMIQYRG